MSRFFDIDRRELRVVALLWIVLMVATGGTLLALNLKATDLINHIEYVKAPRYQRFQVLLLESEKRAVRVLAKAGDLNSTASQRKIVLSTGDPDYVAARDLFSRALAISPLDPYSAEMRPHYERLANIHDVVGAEREEVLAGSRAFLAGGDFRNAESYASILVTRDPRDADGWQMLAEIRVRSGRFAEALDAIARMEAAGGGPADVHRLRASVARLQGDHVVAARELEATMKANPGDVESRKRLAASYLALGRKEDAERAFREGLVSGGTEDGNFMDLYGTLLLDLNHNEEAARAFERGTELESNSASVYWGLARAYLRLGQMARHNSALQRALTLDPTLRTRVMEK